MLRDVTKESYSAFINEVQAVSQGTSTPVPMYDTLPNVITSVFAAYIDIVNGEFPDLSDNQKNSAVSLGAAFLNGVCRLIEISNTPFGGKLKDIPFEKAMEITKKLSTNEEEESRELFDSIELRFLTLMSVIEGYFENAIKQSFPLWTDEKKSSLKGYLYLMTLTVVYFLEAVNEGVPESVVS